MWWQMLASKRAEQRWRTWQTLVWLFVSSEEVSVFSPFTELKCECISRRWRAVLSAALSDAERDVAVWLRLCFLELWCERLEHRRLLQRKRFRRTAEMFLQPHHQLRCSLGESHNIFKTFKWDWSSVYYTYLNGTNMTVVDRLLKPSVTQNKDWKTKWAKASRLKKSCFCFRHTERNMTMQKPWTGSPSLDFLFPSFAWS